jgi:hypothetical protein
LGILLFAITVPLLPLEKGSFVVHISKSYFTEKAVLHRYLLVTAYIFVWWVKLAPKNRKNKNKVCMRVHSFRQWRTWRLTGAMSCASIGVTSVQEGSGS